MRLEALIPDSIPHISWGASRLKIDPSFYRSETDASSTASLSKPVVVKPIQEPASGITANAYLVGNITTGKIYLQKNAGLRAPIASMSKLLTAIVATDTLSPTTTVLITPEAVLAPPDQSGIAVGERYEAQELLYPLLLDSSNIAAEAFSYTGNRTTFLELMSSYAWEVGMPATFFADPSGVDPHNASSANDFFALARYLYVYRPDILALTRTASMRLASTTDHAARQFNSIHPFVNDPRFIGGKTGRTPEAGETMLTLLTLNGQSVAFVVIGSQMDHRATDTSLLIDKVNGLVK